MNTTEDKELVDMHMELTKAEYEKRYKRLKLKLEQIQKKRNGKYLLILGVIVSICCIMLFLVSWSYYFDFKYIIMTQGSLKKFFPLIIFAVILGIFPGIFMVLFGNLLLEGQANRIQNEIIEFESNSIQEVVEEDIFENSIKMSYKYLDQYYLQTREQARKGFFVTVCVAVFGAIILALGIIAMFLGKAEPAYITCAAGVITEFIAAVFFYLYNKTITSMSKYHNKLVLSHNISIALKVSDTLPEQEKVNSKNQIISELLKDINSYLIKSDSGETKTEKKE